MLRPRSGAFYFPKNNRETEDLLKEVIKEGREQEFLRQVRVGFIYPIPEENEEGYTDDEDFVSLDSIQPLGSRLQSFNSNSTDLSDDTDI